MGRVTALNPMGAYALVRTILGIGLFSVLNLSM
jgi:hypothetical protein